MSGELKRLAGYGIALVALAAITLTGDAVLTGFKDSGQVTNATADLFIAGLTLFGTFSSILILAVIGKTIISLFKGGKYE